MCEKWSLATTKHTDMKPRLLYRQLILVKWAIFPILRKLSKNVGSQVSNVRLIMTALSPIPNSNTFLFEFYVLETSKIT